MQYNLKEPFFHKGGAINMPAVDTWENKWYLKQRFQNAVVDIERYNSELDMQVSKCNKFEVDFNDYLDNLYENEYLPDCPLSETNVDPSIFDDLINPDVGPGEPREHLLFVGRNTKSGAHLHVEDDFVLHQIVGTKIVYLMDFEDLTLNDAWGEYANFSKENFFRLPKSINSKIYRVVMEPGDILYIPPWTWHATENIGYTVAVTKVYDRDDSYLKMKRFRKLRYRHWTGIIKDTIREVFYKN
jgi:uncharacterized RmlC-like cupin family protein|tara:strand:- start:1114 stop:1842 length:729 start_codon:yes stop_codon:yes gene_type:complete